MASVRSAIVTSEHPPGKQAVTPQNARTLQAGSAGSAPERTPDHTLETDIKITDEALISAVERREKTQTSLGLDAWIDKTPGVWRGIDGHAPPEPYDVIQRGMITNHIAVTKKARIPGANLHLDSDDGVMVADPESNPTETNMPTTTLKIGDSSVEVDSGSGAVIQAHLARIDSKLATATTQITALTSERDTLQGKLDGALGDLEKQKKLVTDAQNIDIPSLVAARNKLMGEAARVMDAEGLAKVDSATDMDVRKAACKAHGISLADPDDPKKTRSDEYVTARFDSLVESAERTPAQSFAAQVAGTSAVPGPQDSGPQARIATALTNIDSLHTQNLGGLRSAGGAQ
jgi:hypothetical protein